MKNITDMSYMFNECRSLKSLPGVVEWELKNVIIMENMFNNCKSLMNYEILPKILSSKLNQMKIIYTLFN